MGLGIAIQVGGSTDDELSGSSLVEVHERMGEPTTFRVRYPVLIREGDLPMLKDGRLDPGKELAVVLPLDGKNHYLVKGPVHGQQIHLEHGGADSWVEVIGADKSIEMDREVRAEVWADVSAADAVRSIVGRYALAPDVEDTPARHLTEKHALVQRDTDLSFVRRLARRYGFLFWVDADSSGTATAHFRRPQLDGEPQVELDINLDVPSVTALDLSWDVERPTSAVGAQLDLNDKAGIDGAVARSPLAPLGALGLGDIAQDTRTVQLIAPVDDVDDLKGRSEGALIEASWFIRASGETSLRALNKLLRAHTVVNLQGAGSRHSGKYYVCGVRHRIDATAHVMEFELCRNGWGA